MRRGIIVSIQEYSQGTTQELAGRAVQAGAVAIRTDRPVEINVPIIGLKKFHQKEFYITTEEAAIEEVARWAAYVAIDCRVENKERDKLLQYCLTNNIGVIHDIEKLEDFESLPYPPCMTATTFSSMLSGKQNYELIKKLKGQTLIIAEGAIKTKEDARHAFSCGATWVCVGTEIMDIRRKVSEWVNSISGGLA
jgi:putative N-acetylmannosamine-6-phosphate epimerase